ncbi:hypothetical protein [Paragemmobacter ruber]|uniref:Uncharacterized protein n=1 Tax=Paragemmobacter ruber TaxID=1985673 RepID=A0ABW9Y3M6_9RHOB|nr:hypothetical protein [Rhodobacter ruber]NBE06978.1 hypothetical protein [Rhodobacter ruber]
MDGKSSILIETGHMPDAPRLPEADRTMGERLVAEVVSHLRKIAGDRPLVMAAAPQLIRAVRAELDRPSALTGQEKLTLLSLLDKAVTGVASASLPAILQAARDRA